MSGILTATIVVIGDEILGGFTEDANASWLARRLRSHGVELRHVATVPDEFPAIDEAISSALERGRPHLVLTTGGIGSTPDDITYEAVAASLGRELVVAPPLARKIDGAITWTVSHGFDVDDAFVEQMMRMARIPAGAELLRPSGSWAPGVRLDLDGGVDEDGGASIVVLPGVPSQLRSIVEGVVEPEILEGRGAPHEVVEVSHGYPESVLNRCLVHLGETYPDLRVGSYPGDPMTVRLRGRPEDVRAARRDVERYLADLDRDPSGERIRRAWAERTGRSQRPPEAEERDG